MRSASDSGAWTLKASGLQFLLAGRDSHKSAQLSARPHARVHDRDLLRGRPLGHHISGFQLAEAKRRCTARKVQVKRAPMFFFFTRTSAHTTTTAMLLLLYTKSPILIPTYNSAPNTATTTTTSPRYHFHIPHHSHANICKLTALLPTRFWGMSHGQHPTSGSAHPDFQLLIPHARHPPTPHEVGCQVCYGITGFWPSS